jgi:hypothetical protein
MVILPPAIREHPIESLIAMGLLLALLVGANTAQPNPEPHQKVSACAPTGCTPVKPAS